MDFHLNRLAIAFAALGEPCGKGLGQAFRLDAEAGFDLSFAGGKRVIELR